MRQTGNVRLACKTAGISRAAAYKARTNSEAFAADWDEAHDDAVDTLEAIARQRASTTSDGLLMFLLKAHRPDKYRERVETQHTGDLTIIVKYDNADNPDADAS